MSKQGNDMFPDTPDDDDIDDFINDNDLPTLDEAMAHIAAETAELDQSLEEWPKIARICRRQYEAFVAEGFDTAEAFILTQTLFEHIVE